MRALTAAALAGAVVSGCGWISLGVGALGYPVTGSADAGNVVVDGRVAYASAAEAGLRVVDADSGRLLATLPPPVGSDSVDDLAVADGLLFALDAREPGALCVYSLARPEAPVLASPPVAVPVGPFSGVSAGGGRVVVSGGTSELTLRTYAPDGRLGDATARADFGRGQPDVLLSPDGARAFVSTHLYGPHFVLTTARVTTGPPAVRAEGQLPLDTVGFTAGGAKPASFPIEMALDGDVLLVAYARGLALVDVSDLARPRSLGELALGVRGVNVDVRDGTAAVVGSSPSPTLALVDVRDPARPRLVRSVALPDGSAPTGVAIGERRVVVAAGADGVLSLPR